MMGIKGHNYTWNQSWIEFKAPKAEGVYCLLDKDSKVIFSGWRIYEGHDSIVRCHDILSRLG